MSEEDYFQQRLDHQIKWYDKKSMRNQIWFKGLSVISIIASTAIPLVVGVADEITLAFKIAVGGLGFGVAVITSVLGLYKFQENWIGYRTTCESLKHEKFLFLTKTEPYDVGEPFTLLVHRVESLISRENTNWTQYIDSSRKKK